MGIEAGAAGGCAGQNRIGSEREVATMSFLDTLKKGFGFLLLSMGVSRPAPKPKPDTKPAAKGGE
jgi:hypothetical protein